MAETFEQRIETGNDLAADGRYAEALAAFEAARLAANAPDQQARALTRMARMNQRLGETDAALKFVDQAIDLCAPHMNDKAARNVTASHVLAWALHDKGALLASLGRFAEVIPVMDTLILRFADEAGSEAAGSKPALHLCLWVARGFIMKARALGRLSRERDAVACYDDMLRRFGNVRQEGPLMEEVARAMFRRGAVLGNLGRTDEEIAAYDSVIARYGEIHLIGLDYIVLDALENKLLTYRDQEDYETMIEVCDDLIRRYEVDPGEGIADVVGRTMIRKAGALNKLGKTAQELSCYDKVIDTFGHWREPEMRKHAAEALMGKAVTLNDADQTAAEMECYEEILRRYAEDEDERVRAVAAHALIYKGLSLRAISEDAAEDTGVMETEAEIACYDRVVARYGDETYIGAQRAVAEALQRKGEILLETGQMAAAAACFDAVIEGFAAIDDDGMADIVKESRELRAEC